jgi:hypothetical protein
LALSENHQLRRYLGRSFSRPRHERKHPRYRLAMERGNCFLDSSSSVCGFKFLAHSALITLFTVAISSQLNTSARLSPRSLLPLTPLIGNGHTVARTARPGRMYISCRAGSLQLTSVIQTVSTVSPPVLIPQQLAEPSPLHTPQPPSSRLLTPSLS